jgi:type I restriction enzyme S subunit
MVNLGHLIKQAKTVKCGSNDYPVLSMTMHDGLVFQDQKFKKSIASQDRSNYKVVKRNQLVISFPIDEGVLATQRLVDFGIVSPAYGIWDVDERQIIPEYLEYALRSERALEYYKAYLRGSTARRRSLPVPTLLSFQIPVPDIAEQRNVIEILSKVKTLLALRKKELQLLNDLTKARFIEMFGQIGSENPNWETTTLGQCTVINPKKSGEANLKDSTLISFIPMTSVSEAGQINASESKTYSEVRTGFTYFRNNDVLFAKITPCMENGKGAVARGLKNEIGFGSTEFHVLRPLSGITDPYWIYTLLSMPEFWKEATKHMTGSAGQKRVPASYLNDFQISLPPLSEQLCFASFTRQVDKSKFFLF